MAPDNGGSIPHTSTTSVPFGDSRGEPTSKNWRHKPRNLRPHDTVTEQGTVGVLLSNRPVRVWLALSDYQRIIVSFGYRAWAWHERDGGVYVKGSDTKPMSVARLVLEADTSGYVQYRDNDRLNLRRGNVRTELHRMPRRDGTTKEPVGRVPARGRKTVGRKRAPTGPTLRSVSPPPQAQPQAARTAIVVLRKPMPFTQAVKRSTR